MKLLQFLGKHLKNPEVTEILDHLEMDVVYDFDRLYEGQPDKYWAASQQAGLQFRFDSAQTLDTIFLYIQPDEGFSTCTQGDLDVPLLMSITQAEIFGEAQHLQVSKGTSVFLGCGVIGFDLNSTPTLFITSSVQASLHELELPEMNRGPSKRR